MDAAICIVPVFRHVSKAYANTAIHPPPMPEPVMDGPFIRTAIRITAVNVINSVTMVITAKKVLVPQITTAIGLSAMDAK